MKNNNNNLGAFFPITVRSNIHCYHHSLLLFLTVEMQESSLLLVAYSFCTNPYTLYETHV